MGALARIAKYGNPGTPEGRRNGGLNSVLSQTKLDNNFKKAKNFFKPKNSKLLSEFMGILIGDGHLSNYQVSITTNSETDFEHAVYIGKLIKKIFCLESSIKFRKEAKAVNIIVSSVNLVKWLSGMGMPIGNKLVKGISVPNWIKGNDLYEKSFIRGLFDTDGCVYIDKHTIKGKVYRNMGWNFTSYSVELREDIFE